jgi:hypothetical protein
MDDTSIRDMDIVLGGRERQLFVNGDLLTISTNPHWAIDLKHFLEVDIDNCVVRVKNTFAMEADRYNLGGKGSMDLNSGYVVKGIVDRIAASKLTCDKTLKRIDRKRETHDSDRNDNPHP